ncbi:phasin family protein [Xanthomonas melonis]|uniref:Phasin family protein n=1 Tax=Xanthomonas melonis TaxID=56456 RepID=A0A2S7DM40_9XANT|nr:phasin family protein [Xanthomonas melonis]MCC4599019.1 phasin family protein [Xanthomonas melonis]MCD0260455.1 phasin family protein [Xanthomonas melonis]MCD0268635.1 phasin family protein [Xanthomonas melonis]MCD0279234.1 phasin family protein [Xanthomonas melonis]PPU74916.1 hypothetical protein XmelCFBP4644_03145 [Xanthomonas melonis]
MSAQFENSFTSQFASAAARANQLALDTLEQNVNATTRFFGEFAQARDLGAYQTLWPKGLQVARDNLERLASANQEVVGMGLKMSGEFGQFAKQHFEHGGDPAGASAKSRRR